MLPRFVTLCYNLLYCAEICFTNVCNEIFILCFSVFTSVCDCFVFCCLKPERSTWKKHGRACVVGLMAGGVKVPKEAAAMSPRQQEDPNDQGDQDEVDNDKGQHSQT